MSLRRSLERRASRTWNLKTASVRIGTCPMQPHGGTYLEEPYIVRYKSAPVFGPKCGDAGCSRRYEEKSHPTHGVSSLEAVACCAG